MFGRPSTFSDCSVDQRSQHAKNQRLCLNRGHRFKSLSVVRVKFKSANGRVYEGNVLIDSGTGITIIQKDFASSRSSGSTRKD